VFVSRCHWQQQVEALHLYVSVHVGGGVESYPGKTETLPGDRHATAK
jgi:hypothetical protein